MREYEPRKKGLMSNDYDEYDPTDLLSCVQDCGRWPLGQRSVNVMTYDPGLDWCAGPANLRVPPPRRPPAPVAERGADSARETVRCVRCCGCCCGLPPRSLCTGTRAAASWSVTCGTRTRSTSRSSAGWASGT